jgi:serine/threonine protein kinase
MDPLKPADPRTLGGIRLHGPLGEGGMGRVYFGVTSDGVRVAVKVIHAHLADRTDIRARFDREIAALQMVQARGSPRSWPPALTGSPLSTTPKTSLRSRTPLSIKSST